MLATYPGNGRAPVDMVTVSPCIDVEAAERAAAALLAALGIPDGSEAALGTPVRMVAGLAELLSSAPWESTTFPNPEGTRGDDGNGPSLTHCVPLRCRNVALTPGNVLALRQRLAGLDDKLASDVVLEPAGTGSGTIPPSCRRDQDRRGTPPARRPAPATT